jgi:hypothetical protein
MPASPSRTPIKTAYSAPSSASDSISDGSTASYYELPAEASQLQDLISFRNMNAQDGEIFRAVYRKGRVSHSSQLRDAKKILFYAQAEVARLEKYQNEGETQAPELHSPHFYDTDRNR